MNDIKKTVINSATVLEELVYNGEFSDELHEVDFSTVVPDISSLENLRDVLNARALNGFDVSSLPTFGGDTPEDTHEVYSWDEENVLIWDGDNWEIAAR